MKRVMLFLALLVAGTTSILVTAVWYLTGYQSGNASVTGMMGQMMGNQYASGMPIAMPSYLWLLLVALIVVTVGGAGGLAYYLAYPEIRTARASVEPAQSVAEAPGAPRIDWSVLLRTSKPEEKRVLEVVASHGGKYLQKFIVKESGLTKLKTHRIISRLAERGVVTVARSGNTNEVSLASWLGPDSTKAPSR